MQRPSIAVSCAVSCAVLAAACLTEDVDDGPDDVGTAEAPLTWVPPPPPPPPPLPQLLAPLDPQITLRRSNRLRLAWRDRTTLESGYTVERKVGAGAWSLVASYGAQPTAATVVTELSGLQPQTLACVRVRAFNATTAAYSPARCMYTKADVSRSLQRVRVEIATAAVAGAGTDDRVSVRLDSPPISAVTTTYLPRGNRTFLDLPGDDFAPGTTRRYDLIPPSDLGELTQLYLEKEGGDSWCVREVRLIANESMTTPGGRILFERSFGDNAATCRWINSGTGFQPFLTVPFDELRGHPRWQTALATPWTCANPAACATELFPMEMETLEDRLEGVIGHALAASGTATWGPMTAGEGLHLTNVDPFTIRAEFQALETVTSTTASFRAKLRLRATATPTGSLLGMEVEEVEAGVDIYDPAEVLADLFCFAVTLNPTCFALGDFIERYLEGRVEDRFTPINQSVEVPRVGGGCVVLRAPDPAGDAITPTVAPCNDLDQDRMDDAWELEHGLNPQHNWDGDIDNDGDGASNEQEFLAGTDPNCAWMPGDASYCRDCGPCARGEGDCDSDAECTGADICADNVGASYGLPPSTDVCECPWQPGDNNYCRDCGPCGLGEGDCDSDAECAPGGTCRSDVGASYGFAADVDVCECALARGDDRYCELCGPCAVGGGDCDSSAECAPGTTCAIDVGLSYGYTETTDVCVCAGLIGCPLPPVLP